VANSHLTKPYSEIYQDWGDIGDDLNSDEWASGGPPSADAPEYDVDEAEDYEPEDDQSDYDCSDDDNAVDGDEDADEASEESMETCRIEEIITWLAGSRLARKFRSGGGFFVPSALRVRFPDGRIQDVLEWLGNEGIVGGVCMGGYSIVYTPPESIYGEKLSFFEVIYDTPFSPSKGECCDFDDDIPF